MADGMIAVQAGALRAVVAAICDQAGCSAEESTAIAGHLVEANLTGHDSHGVCKIPEYVNAIRGGRLKLGRHAVVSQDGGAVVVIDGGGGVGQVVAREAMQIGIERARRHGVGVIALRRAHHIGRIGAWAEQCAAAGMASLHFVNVIGHAPYVAPFGGSDGRLATNPIAIGVPRRGRPPILLDMATSKVAWGKMLVAANKGVAAPEGALLDATGRPTTDPTVLFKRPMGALLPFGEHKGYAFAVMADLLAGALAGGGANRPEHNATDTSINSMLSIILRPEALGDAAAFAAEVEGFADWVKASPPASGVDAVLLPGEPEEAMRAARGAAGIPIDPETWRQLLETAESIGCDRGELTRLAEIEAP